MLWKPVKREFREGSGHTECCCQVEKRIEMSLFLPVFMPLFGMADVVGL